MKSFLIILCTVMLAMLCNKATAEDRTSLGVEFVSIKERIPIKSTNNPDTYRLVTPDSYIVAGPKLTMVRKMLYFETAVQALLSKPQMENTFFPSDSTKIDSAYNATAILGVVLRDSFTPYVGLGYSQEKSTFKGNYNSTTAFSAKGNTKTTDICVGVRSIIPLTKMFSIYGDGKYIWSDSKTDTDLTVTNTSTHQTALANDSSHSHDRGFSIDAGLEFTPVANITIRTLIGIGRTKESSEPESETLSYTVGLFYNF